MDFIRVKEILVGSVFGLLGLGVLIYGIVKLNEASESESWPHTKGTILSSEIKSKVTTTKKNGRTKRKTNYFPVLSYSYSVNGKNFTGNKLGFVTVSNSSRSDAQKKVKKYPKGSEVDVYYETGNPGNAVIEKGIKSSIYILPGLGLAFLIAGIVIIIYEIR